MEKTKLSLANVQGKLSRAEMKEILAGDESLDGAVCHVGLSCSLVVGGTTYIGTCDAGFGGGSGGYMPCGCATSYGVYEPTSNGGVSRCQS
jgi:hypothetical protein